MKRRRKWGVLGAAFFLSITMWFSACAFQRDEGNLSNGDASEKLTYENLTKLAFMGGSVIYNPNLGVDGHLVKNARIGVRLSRVEIDESVTPPEYKEVSNATKYGYITVTNVDYESITLSYSEFSSTGILSRNVNTTTITAGGTGDINKDGNPDVTYAPVAFKRSGMENSLYLTFIASQENGNVGMYSIIPEQYSRSAYPNGILGVNPDGKLIMTTHQPNGARAATRGAEYGDIVVDPITNRYGTIKNGANYRTAALRIGDTGTEFDGVEGATDWIVDKPLINVDVGDDSFSNADPAAINDLNVGIKTPTDPGNDEVTENGNFDFFEEDHFTLFATPQGLFEALPSSLKTTAPSTDEGYITALNDILKTAPATLIQAVLDNETLDAELTAMAGALKGETYTTTAETVSVNRAFLVKAYPSLCPPAAAKSMQEMFPILSVSFSSGDSNEVVAEQIRMIRSANQEFLAMQSNSGSGNARQAMANKSAYDARRDQIINNFNKNFTNAGTFAMPKEVRDVMKKYFTDSTMTLSVGLYGSITSYWGKIELGVGAAILVHGEVEGPKGTIKEKFKIKEIEKNWPVQVGPVLLDVGLSGEFGIKADGTVAMSNLFAGFVGLYGGRVWVGADYGIKWKWKIIPVGAYFNPYARSEKISETAYFIGRKNPNLSLGTVGGSIKVGPYLNIGPKLTLWKAIYGKIGAVAEIPYKISATASTSNLTFSYSAGFVYGVQASAGIKYDFKIFKYSREFGSWDIVPKKEYALQGETALF